MSDQIEVGEDQIFEIEMEGDVRIAHIQSEDIWLAYEGEDGLEGDNIIAIESESEGVKFLPDEEIDLFGKHTLTYPLFQILKGYKEDAEKM